MHIDKLGTYQACRAMCEGKRYRNNGRRIDNYTVLRLIDRDTPNERIAIARKSWRPYDKTEQRKPPEPFAWYYPNHIVKAEAPLILDAPAQRAVQHLARSLAPQLQSY